MSRTHHNTNTNTSPNKHNVGILAMETYFPATYLEQSELEAHMQVSPGKYTLGLGQHQLSVVAGDAEDIHSLCLTVVQRLLDSIRDMQVLPSHIGRLEVGTETLIDHSKSTKTVLMQLFDDDKNNCCCDMEGATVVNACYGGTSALLNAFYWCESSAADIDDIDDMNDFVEEDESSECDGKSESSEDDEDTNNPTPPRHPPPHPGKYAIVVAADIATYAAGPARPTCGAGAVALLIGRNAPLVFHPHETATFAAHTWDFYKPNPHVEHPVVHGALSQSCYYTALEHVYESFLNKLQKKNKKKITLDDMKHHEDEDCDRLTVETAADYYCFHAPYNKLVQKSFARLYLLDARRQHQRNQAAKARARNHKKKKNHEEETNNHENGGGQERREKEEDIETLLLQPWLDVPIQETYNDKALDKVLQTLSAHAFQTQCFDANVASQHIGNTYTASIFFGLASLLDRLGGRTLVDGTTIGMFSYGSGALATMYRLHVRTPTTPAAHASSSSSTGFSIARMFKTLHESLSQRLSQRVEVHPSELEYALDVRARMHQRTQAAYSVRYDPIALIVSLPLPFSSSSSSSSPPPLLSSTPDSRRTMVMFPGTYYLQRIDEQWRRHYARLPPVNPDREEHEQYEQDPPPVELKSQLTQKSSCSDTNHDTVTHWAPNQQPITTPTKTAAVPTETIDSSLPPPPPPPPPPQLIPVWLEAQRRTKCVITGTAAGLPGLSSPNGRVFHPDNLDRLIAGHSCITPISGSVKAALLEKNVVRLVKQKKNHHNHSNHNSSNNNSSRVVREPIVSDDQVIQLAAQLSSLDLTAAYGVPPGLAQTMDVAAQVAVASGMEALKNAGLVSGRTSDASEWKLPLRFRDTTGVVYASSFPAMDAAVGEVMRFLQSKTVGATDSLRLIEALRSRLLRASPDRELSVDDEAAFARLAARAREVSMDHNHSHNSHNNSSNHNHHHPPPPPSPPSMQSEKYEFDRKFLFRVLVLGNAQLAQLAGIRGPNTQTNAACAGTTQAIAMAQDMLISGRAERVVVVAGDNAAGETLLPWLGCGFSALGAATTQACVEDAACPFDQRRSGLLLGAGGIGMVIETEASMRERRQEPQPCHFQVKARLLLTQYSNSAFHGASLDRTHIGEELVRFLRDVKVLHGISKTEIATHGVYFSHETSTHASPSSSCAANEIAALRYAFDGKGNEGNSGSGDDEKEKDSKDNSDLVSKMLIVNTKGFTGHPMGVSFEDVAAVEALVRQHVPPVANYREKDDYLGDLNISKGGPYACRYALRFAAGFGSQVAFALYATYKEESVEQEGRNEVRVSAVVQCSGGSHLLYDSAR